MFDDGLAGDEGDVLEVCVFRFVLGVGDGGVFVLGVVQGVGGCQAELGFGDEVNGLGDGEWFDCLCVRGRQ